MRPAARITVCTLALLGLASACTLEHAALSVGGDTPDVATGLDAVDAQPSDMVASEPPDVVASADGTDVPPALDAPIAMDAQPDAQPDAQLPDVQPDVQPDVPGMIPPGHDCSAGRGLCAMGSQCLTFTGGGTTPPAVVCAVCGEAGQRKCVSGAACRGGTTPDNVSGLCIPGDIDTRCGGPGGACLSGAPFVVCPDCGAANERCLSTGAGIPAACATCGGSGEPCCCTSGPPPSCHCSTGLTCSGGGAGGYTVCH